MLCYCYLLFCFVIVIAIKLNCRLSSEFTSLRELLSTEIEYSVYVRVQYIRLCTVSPRFTTL